MNFKKHTKPITPTKISVLVLSLLLSACASRGTAVKLPERNMLKGVFSSEVENKSQAMHAYLVGELAYKEDDFDLALKELSRASELSIEPVAQLHSKLAELYVRENKYAKAFIESEKALAIEPSSVELYLLKASILESLQQRDQALEVYQQAIALDPKNSNSYLLLSNLYVKEGNFEQAIGTLERNLQLNPGPEADYYLGLAFEISGNLKKSAEHLKRSFSLAENNPQVGMDLVRIRLKLGDSKGAKTVCDKILASNPNYFPARKVLSQIFLTQGNLDAALTQLMLSLEKETQDNSDTLLRISLLLLEQRKFDEALKYLQQLSQQNPERQEFYYYIASANLGLKEPAKALENLEKISSANIFYPKALILKAIILREQGKSDLGIEALESAVEAAPDNIDPVLMLLSFYGELDQDQKARELLEQAQKKFPNNEKLIFSSAILASEQGDETLARSYMQQVVALNPKNTDALNFLAYSWAEAGEQLENALIMVQQALSLKPEDGYYLDTLAWIYFKRGLLEQAEEAIVKAVYLVPRDPIIAEHYADILLSRGKVEQSISLYRHALDLAKASKNREGSSVAERAIKKIELIQAGKNLEALGLK